MGALLKVAIVYGKSAVIKAGISVSKINPSDFITQDNIHDVVTIIKGVLF